MTQTETILNALTDLLAPKVAELLRDTQPEKELYSVADLAKRYSVSRETISRRIRAGEFGETINMGERRKMVTAAGVRLYDEAHLGAPYTRQSAAATRSRFERRCPVTKAEWREHITSLYPVYEVLPEGWKITDGALTAPAGYVWIDNGKGFYTHRGERKQALLKLKGDLPLRRSGEGNGARK